MYSTKSYETADPSTQITMYWSAHSRHIRHRMSWEFWCDFCLFILSFSFIFILCLFVSFFFIFCICHCGIIVFIKCDFCQSLSIDACTMFPSELIVCNWIYRSNLIWLRNQNENIRKKIRRKQKINEKQLGSLRFIGILCNIFIRVLNLTADLSHIYTGTHTQSPEGKAEKTFTHTHTHTPTHANEGEMLWMRKMRTRWGNKATAQYLLHSVWSLKHKCG